MTVREITAKTEWEYFMSIVKPHSFLSTWNWGEVQEQLGTKIFRLGIYESDTLIGIALILHIKARRGTFLFCPHGPVIKKGINERLVLQVLLETLKSRGQELGCAFIRFSPLFEDTRERRQLFVNLGFRNAPIHLMHPELAWLLDVTKNEETLLKEMRKTTRYLIRKAEKDGVVVKMGESEQYLQEFLAVYRTTVDRQQFTPFKDEFFKKELEVFRKDNQVKIFLAEYQGRTIATAMIVFYGASAFYHHGASDQSYSQIPGSYLLQWQVIKEARSRGYSFYDFWGIVRSDEKKHPWAGLSLFKTGFGGFEEAYLHVQDYVLSPRYWLVYAIETARRKWRKL